MFRSIAIITMLITLSWPTLAKTPDQYVKDGWSVASVTPYFAMDCACNCVCVVLRLYKSGKTIMCEAQWKGWPENQCHSPLPGRN
jgi:hypothetical protein